MKIEQYEKRKVANPELMKIEQYEKRKVANPEL